MAATILLCLTGASFASENICGTTKEMMNAEFWVKGTKTAHETILAPAEVQALTAKIREAPCTFCTDILDYPDFLSREEFARKIKSYAARPDNKRYVGAAEADGEFWRRVESNANPGAADETTLVRFGAVEQQAEHARREGGIFEDSQASFHTISPFTIVAQTAPVSVSPSKGERLLCV